MNLSLNHPLNRRLDRSCVRWATTMLAGARRPRQPDELALACRYINQALRIHQRMAKRDPHLFGPHAHRYYQDTVGMARLEAEVEAALCKIYGPPKPGDPPPGPDVWTRRYGQVTTPQQHRIFLHWFKENYG